MAHMYRMVAKDDFGNLFPGDLRCFLSEAEADLEKFQSTLNKARLLADHHIHVAECYIETVDTEAQKNPITHCFDCAHYPGGRRKPQDRCKVWDLNVTGLDSHPSCFEARN